MLYFHDKEDYVYDGEYTYDAFSALHELEFMYPETIYNYTCKYYKDNTSDSYEVGSVLATVQVPDTSTPTEVNIHVTKSMNADKVYAVPVGEQVEIVGKISSNDEGDWYPVRYQTYAGFMKSIYVNPAEDPETVITTASNELGRASFSCSIGDWNPDWDVFIASSWKVDENGNDINPQLYRDAELTLTWDYFGFDRNLFKPEGYFDGIYLWNPRSWDHGDIRFNFRELVRTGSQTILYPSIPVDMFKIANNTSDVSLPMTNITGESPKFSVNLRDHSDTAEIQNFYDFDLVFDPSTASSYNYAAEYRYVANYGFGSTKAYNGAEYTKANGPTANITAACGEGWYHGTNGMGGHVSYSMTFVTSASGRVSGLTYKEPGDYFTVNISNHREDTSFVIGHGNTINGQKEKYYLTDGTQIIASTNLDGHYAFDPFDAKFRKNGEVPLSGVGSEAYYGHMSATIQPITVPKDKNASGMSAALYQNFWAQHYWVPVPKGYWYKFNGEDLRIPSNGWYDLMTGKFVASTGGTIYFRNQIVGVDEKYDYFKNWDYVSDDIDYIVKVNTASSTYHQPDLYAINVGNLAQNLVLPVSKVTSDADNRVVGEWYYSSIQWFESKNASIYAGNFDKTKLTKLQQSLCIVKPATEQTYYVYLDPSEVTTPGESSDASYSNTSTLMTAYYNYVDSNGNKYYFDGAYWVPEKYTSFNTVEWNKNYAIVPDNLTFYSHPIENEAYEAGKYHYGDRITVLYLSAQDEEWGYTGLGWIKVNANTVNEVV